MFERLDSRFDVLTQVLDAVHLGSALSARTELRAPWALRFGKETGHRAGFHIVRAGQCWASLDAAGSILLGPGDVVVFPHGAEHTLGDHPDTPALDFGALVADLRPGERIELPTGGRGDPAILLCGSYSFGPDGANPLLRGLPDVLLFRAEEIRGGELESAVRMLGAEADGFGAGSALVVDRLVDLLFVYALRTWLSLHEAATTSSWFGALQDSVVGTAVRAVHDNPAHPWTVATLADRSGTSRASFARQFRRAIGEPPLAYVTRWRMTLAADLLENGERVALVADRVGYDNEFAFAKAFKRVRGVTPGQHRHRFNTARSQ